MRADGSGGSLRRSAEREGAHQSDGQGGVHGAGDVRDVKTRVRARGRKSEKRETKFSSDEMSRTCLTGELRVKSVSSDG